MEEDEGRSTRVPWLNVARYAILVVVTVLNIGVIAWAIIHSLRPEVLYFSVEHGYVTVGRIKSMSPPVSVVMSLMIYTNNYGSRAAIRYDNVSVHLLYNNSDSSEITYLNVRDKMTAVPPLSNRITYIKSQSLTAPEDVGMDFALKMFKGYEIKNATVRLDGRIHTKASPFKYKRGRFTMYRCYPVTIGTSLAAHEEDDDVYCTVS